MGRPRFKARGPRNLTPKNSKYNSSKGSYGSSSDRYDRVRDSPNGNFRSDSPDSQSPRDRDRSYQSKGSYLQKIREKERENRDYKVSRDKYSDCARSPKDKRSRDSEHRTNNDRNDEKSILHPIKMTQNLSSRDRKPVHNNSVDKVRLERDDRERGPRVGDWSEHVSSSGKKYYYNCKTEVSQWEKPREWVDRERDRFRSRDRDRDRDSDRYSRSTRHDKHSRTINSGCSKDGRDGGAAAGSRHWSTGGGSRGGAEDDGPRCPRKHPDENAQSQDMDISSGDSTPTSEVSYGGGGGGGGGATAGPSGMAPTDTCGGTTVGPLLLANALPRFMSHPTIHHHHHHHGMPPAPGCAESAQQVQATVSSAAGPMMVPPVATMTTCNAPGPPSGGLPRMLSQTSCNEADNKNSHGPSSLASRLAPLSDSAVHTSLSVDINHTGTVVEGPPTPTHSETPDCASKVVSAPVSSPPGNLSTLQGMSSSLQALRPQGPSITPSLANHYRDDLVNHVRGWPAEILEKQAQKLADDTHIIGSIQCSKVSAELKSARSIVRLTEIQATLQEQRVLFLRQQIKELEELKSQNSFMSDDS